MTTRFELADLGKALEKSVDFFICSASFEARCLTVARAVAENSNCSSSLVFFSGDGEVTAENRKYLRTILPGEIIEARLSVSSPVVTADAVSASLRDLLENRAGRVLLDVTTFTHEQLLIVMRFLSHLLDSGRTKVSVEIAYTGALQYGADSGGGEMWLSRGVREIRPVIGFSGRFKTGQTTQLIILVGFEHERARAAVEYLEPGILSLGVGSGTLSISPELADINSLYCEALMKFIKNLNSAFPNIQRFDISLIDPRDTCKSILEIADPEHFNVVVCPMNTKLSTIGAALAARSDPRIQLMYVEPLEYNEIGYSVSSTGVRFGTFPY